MSQYQAGLIIIAFLFGSCVTVAASPNTALKTACAGDRQRLCSAFVGNQSEMQKCMQAHRAQWSANCAAAAPHAAIAAGKTTTGGLNKSGGVPPKGSGVTLPRHDKCIAYVQAKYFTQNGIAHRTEAPAELRRCMHGEPIDESDSFPSWGEKTW